MEDAIAMPSGLEEGGGRASTGGGEANSQLLRLVARACVTRSRAKRFFDSREPAETRFQTGVRRLPSLFPSLSSPFSAPSNRGS